jgi:uncharacterized protein YgbK (DUF1537 family)
MSGLRLVILADDLTGAADSAARCVQAGLAAVVWLDDAATPAVTTPVLARSTDSRALPPDEAAARVRAALAQLPPMDTAIFYKKIDSTLRGNLGAELDAVADHWPARPLVICPAFPAQGRGLEAGLLRFAGSETPRHLPTLLAAQSRLPTGSIGLAEVRAGEAVLAQRLAAVQAQGARLIVVDGMAEADLAVIVAAARRNGMLLCGSAGMVAPLAASLAPQAAHAPVAMEAVPGPILMVVGSGSAQAHAQVHALAAAETVRVRVLDRFWYELDLVGAKSKPVGDWLIHLAEPLPDTPLEGATARAQAAQLADLAVAAVARLQPGTVLLVGGDTATFVLQRLGVGALQVVAELLPGIPLALGRDRQGVLRGFVLKPGSFGDAATLVTLQTRLHQWPHSGQEASSAARLRNAK